MGRVLRAAVFVSCLALSLTTDPGCVIELECAECVPDNLPLVTSHGARGGRVTAAEGEEVVLACRGGKFLQYPLLATVAAVCEGGRYRVRHDGVLRHLLELGCQENLFEDVMHEVEWCGSPLQGRAYQVQEPTSRATRHLATLCFDSDRGVAVRAHSCNAPRGQLALRAHSERTGPLSLLGNFNHMFDARTRGDAERLYGDEARMNRRLRELLKHERHTFADQSLTAGKLLSGDYFEDQDARVTDFVSNKVAVWRSVAAGNLRHLQRDVADLLQAARGSAELHVYSGTHGVGALRSSRTPLYLKPGGRFPVPRYVWTVVVEGGARGRAVALVLLNDPYVAVGEIRDALFCESSCSKVQWARALRRHLNYETPLYGLVFCCEVHQFANVVTEMPKDAIKNVPLGEDGLLTRL